MVALAVLCSGCPDPNIYGTPRTTPVGKLSQVAALQVAHHRADATAQDRAINATTLLPPMYQLRLGVLDTVDVGIRVALLSSLGADVKWNFVRTDVFDMAVDPSIQAAWWDACTTDDEPHGQVYGNLPLLLGINATDALSIVPTVGVTYGCTQATRAFPSSPVSEARIRGWMLRVGWGLDFRVTPKLAFHPEVTYLSYLGSNSEPAISWLAVGLGVRFGALPHQGGP